MKKIIIFFLLPLVLHAQWIKQESGTIENLTDVVMLDSVTAIAVGESRSILRTTDSGNTWVNVTIMLSSVVPWNGVSFIDSLCGIVTGSGSIRLTSDGGRKWWYFNISPFKEYTAPLYYTSNDIYVGADSGWICHSSDSGKTWTSEKIGDSPVRSIFAWQNSPMQWPPAFALTSNSLYRKIGITANKWEKVASLFHGLGSEAFDGEIPNGGGHSFIVGVQGDKYPAPTVLRSTENDSIWESVFTGINETGILNGLSSPSGKVVYVCGSGGMIYKSIDSGDSWEKESTPSTQNTNAIHFINESRGFAVGDSGLILFRSGDPATNVINGKENIPDEFKLYQNFPNPFNPVTKIRFTIPVAAYSSAEGGTPLQNVLLKVYDILGNEVATLVNKEQPEGNYEVDFDGSKLSSGIYFYVLNFGNQRLSKKMCLIK